MPDLLTFIIICAVGTIGVTQWFKEFVQVFTQKQYDNLYKVILSLLLSTFSGFLIWKIKYPEETYYMMIPLALGVLAIVQLGYETIIKYLQQVIEGLMKKMVNNEQDK